MPEKFRNKYRIASHRKPNWDYSADALYFLTIVTQHRKCNLGQVIHSKDISFVELSDFGRIVETEWFKSFEIRKELFLHEFVIMPNHLHAIVEICNENPLNKNVDINNVDINNVDIKNVEMHGRASLRNDNDIRNDTNDIFDNNTPDETELLSIKRNPPKRMPKSISSFMAGFKSAVNTKINDYIDQHQLNIPKYNRHNHFFQANYHDHIIRNYREYINISRYIIQNPRNWGKDKFYGNNKFSRIS